MSFFEEKKTTDCYIRCFEIDRTKVKVKEIHLLLTMCTCNVS